MSEEEKEAPPEPTLEEKAQMLVALEIQEQEARMYQAQLELQVQQGRLQMRRLLAQRDVKRVVEQLS